MDKSSPEIFHLQKDRAFELRSSTANDRKTKLRKLLKAMWDHEDQILEATRKDFGKPFVETLLTELLLVSHEIHTALRQLDEWMRPRSVPSGLLLFGARSEVHYEPRGVCLVISPWNYPWQLALAPIAAAIAAGNTVMLKPSELTPNSSELLEKILSETFSEDEVCVFLGGKEVSEELLHLPFDHIFFTGSTEVGKIVMAAAAKNLSSVTLELGGKSPAIVDASADLKWAAERLVWGKWVNAGQTCVAPDTLYVERSVWPELFEKIKENVKKFSENVTQDLSEIVTSRHHTRLQEIAKEALQNGWKMVFESNAEPSISRRLPLQIFEIQDTQAAGKSRMGQEEIFGPLMPVVLFDDFKQLVKDLRLQPKPLALYLFSKSLNNEELLIEQSTSGALLINDVLVHLGNANLPFGGVGTSGMGRYHGEYGFLTFSHEKAVLKQGPLKWLLRYFEPPYSPRKKYWARRLARLKF